MGFTEVLTSPLHRATRTCELAGFEGRPGPTRPRRVGLRRLRGATDRGHPSRATPAGSSSATGAPAAKSVEAVGARADRVIARLRGIEGRVLLFGHGHFFRVLAARWLGLPAGDARHFLLGTASLSILGYEHNPRSRSSSSGMTTGM